MIAGGTGITPMLQVIRAIIRGRKAGDRTEVDLIFANVTQQDILLKEDLDELAASDPGVRVHYVLDKPPEGWTGGVGYVTSDMITVSLHFYSICHGFSLIYAVEMAPCSCSRCQDTAVRPPSDD